MALTRVFHIHICIIKIDSQLLTENHPSCPMMAHEWCKVMWTKLHYFMILKNTEVFILKNAEVSTKLNFFYFLVCDQKFFDELAKEASEISGCFTSRARRLVHRHDSVSLRRYACCLQQCFAGKQTMLLQEGKMLLDYVMINAIAVRKILKKYDKVRCDAYCFAFSSKSNMHLNWAFSGALLKKRNKVQDEIEGSAYRASAISLADRTGSILYEFQWVRCWWIRHVLPTALMWSHRWWANN